MDFRNEYSKQKLAPINREPIWSSWSWNPADEGMAAALSALAHFLARLSHNTVEAQPLSHLVPLQLQAAGVAEPLDICP